MNKFIFIELRCSGVARQLNSVGVCVCIYLNEHSVYLISLVVSLSFVARACQKQQDGLSQ